MLPSDDYVSVILQTQLTDEVKDGISAFINDFTTTYLLKKWDIRYEYNPPDTSASSDPDYFLNRMRERAAKHAKSAVDEAVSSEGRAAERKKESEGGKTKKTEEIPADINKGSWEYKSIVEKQHIKQEKKTEFRRGQKFEDASEKGAVIWGFNDMSARKYKIKDAIFPMIHMR